MCEARGLRTDAISAISNDELVALQNEGIFALPVDDDTAVIYSMMDNLKKTDLVKKINSLENQPKVIILIVKEDKVNASLKNSIIDNHEVRIDVFEMRKLLFNIAEHEIVPKHRVIKDPVEIQRIIDSYGVQSGTQMHLITRDDPMAQYLGAVPGDIVEITRNSVTAGKSIVYRFCVKGGG
jgi:DNA-directed RNA polymerase subunit H (RpoH/RPB5)